MAISNETFDRIAELAKLDFDATSKAAIMKDLEKIIAFVDKLNEIDTTGVEPLIYMNDDSNVLRADEVTHELNHEAALQNAPDRDSDYFRVPKVIKRKG